MEDTRTGVVSPEADSHIVCGVVSDRDNVAEDRIDSVDGRVASAAEHPELVTVKMHRVL